MIPKCENILLILWCNKNLQKPNWMKITKKLIYKPEAMIILRSHRVGHTTNEVCCLNHVLFIIELTTDMFSESEMNKLLDT